IARGRIDKDEPEDPHLGALHDVAPETHKIVVAVTPGVHPGGDAGSCSHRIRFDTRDGAPAVINMRMEVDQAWDDIKPTGIDRVASLFRGDGVFDRRDLPVQDG